MVSHNNYSWSDHNLAENGKISNFAFGVNDIILIEFDPDA